MGQILSAITSEKEPTPRKKEYTPSSHYQYNVRQTVPAAREKKEVPQWKRSEITTSNPLKYKTSQATTKRSSRELDDWDLWFARLHQANKQTSKAEENITSLYRSYSTVTKPERKTTSFVKENTTSVPYRSYSTTTKPERRTTSRAEENASSFSYLQAKKTNSLVKENSTPLPHRSSNTIGRKTTTGVKENRTSLLASISERKLTYSNRQDIKKITEIVTHLLRNSDFIVFGNWSCHHWPSQCDNEYEWQSRLTRESLKRYLTLSPEHKYNFFVRSCEECDEESLISSFFLYNQQPLYSNKTPNVEIIRHLVWNNHYRVFAGWECQRLQHRHRLQHKWNSSYTWISLQKFIEKAPAKDLKPTDYYTQKCHDCRSDCNDCKNKPKEKRGCRKCDYEGAVVKYDNLKLSEGGKPHKRWLCAKCQEGATCVRTDYSPARRNRKIELFNSRY